MNTIQRGISTVAAAIVILMILMPPSVTYSVFGRLRPRRPGSGLGEGEVLVPGYEYKFIAEATIDAPVLIAQIIAVLAIAGLLIIVFWDKKSAS